MVAVEPLPPTVPTLTTPAPPASLISNRNSEVDTGLALYRKLPAVLSYLHGHSVARWSAGRIEARAAPLDTHRRRKELINQLMGCPRSDIPSWGRTDHP
jgi:hypothetical protein